MNMYYLGGDRDDYFSDPPTFKQVMSRASALRSTIIKLQDDIASAESEVEVDGSTSFDIDTAYCKIADYEVELRELEKHDEPRPIETREPKSWTGFSPPW